MVESDSEPKPLNCFKGHPLVTSDSITLADCANCGTEIDFNKDEF